MARSQLGKLGRPSIFTQEMADLICSRVATHTCGIKKLCLMYDDMPDNTAIFEWRLKNSQFARQYADAKILQAEILAEDILDIADDSEQDAIIGDDGKARLNHEFAARSRLRIDSRKWLASKLVPKVYGELRQAESSPDETLSKIQALVADINKTNISDV